jgi:AAA+ ATPase superfamily predicted ATPase
MEELLLELNGLLYNEPMRILLDEQRSAVQPYSILSLVANGVNRLSEIGARLEKPASNLSRPMQFLQDIHLIKRELPFGSSGRNTKKSLYKLADPFLDFYYTFILPNKSLIELGKISFVMDIIREGMERHVGHWWEELVRSSIPHLEINGQHFGLASRYWASPEKNVDVELDAVAKSEDNNHLPVIECKWQEEPDRQKILHQLKEQSIYLPGSTGKQIHYVLASKNPKEQSPFDAEIGPEHIILKNA